MKNGTGIWVSNEIKPIIMKRIIYLLFLLVAFTGQAQNKPYIGGQIIIEPGQTPEQIDNWFRLLHENGMSICRILLFEDHLRKKDGTWDFSLYDLAFKAAEKYNIKVMATLFPISSGNYLFGGVKHPESEQHLKQIATYIEKTVSHFKSFGSLYSWVLMNEPGGMGIPQTQWAKQQFEIWKSKQEKPLYNSKGYASVTNFDDKKFLLDINTWYLNWLAQEVKKYDSQKRELHVNPAGIYNNIAEYDFPAWRSILTSLGCSAHPSWHYGYFKRKQYTMALAANCEIVRSGAGALPFWVTELQGGNNTYSGRYAFCPTAEEITQWLWISLCSGAEGVVFWCFNYRAMGQESGEWAMLDFQDKPTDRVLAAKDVSACLLSNQQLFSNAKAVESPVNILYTRESLWTEGQIQLVNESPQDYEGRLQGGVMKSALAFYEILAEDGIKSNFKEINEFDWTKTDYSGTCVILANQVAIPSIHWKHLENFVRNGGKLIVEGLTAFFDENRLSLNNTGFPLKTLFGGALSEAVCIPGNFKIPFGNAQIPVHLWKSYIDNQTGSPLATENGHTTAIRNTFGKGNVVWIPSLVGLGARISGNKAPLSDFLRKELGEEIKRLPFIFTSRQEGVIMQSLQTGDGWITALVNKNDIIKNIGLTNHSLKPSVIFPKKNNGVSEKNIIIAPEETVVVHWRSK